MSGRRYAATDLHMTKFFLSLSLCSVLHFQFIYGKQSQALKWRMNYFIYTSHQSQAFFKGRLEPVILEFTPNSVDSHIAIKGIFGFAR